MGRAGLVLDYLGEGRLRRVAEGEEALHSAVRDVKETRETEARIGDLPDDLRALVEAGELTVKNAERRARLSDLYAKLVAAGDLDLDEAEHLNERDRREREESIRRAVNHQDGFVIGYDVAAFRINLGGSPTARLKPSRCFRIKCGLLQLRNYAHRRPPHRFSCRHFHLSKGGAQSNTLQ